MFCSKPKNAQHMGSSLCFGYICLETLCTLSFLPCTLAWNIQECDIPVAEWYFTVFWFLVISLLKLWILKLCQSMQRPLKLPCPCLPSLSRFLRFYTLPFFYCLTVEPYWSSDHFNSVCINTSILRFLDLSAISPLLTVSDACLFVFLWYVYIQCCEEGRR